MKNFFLKLKRFIYGNKTAGECVVYSFVFIIFALFAFSYLFVLFWTLLAGMRTHDSVVLYPFEDMFKDLNFVQLFSMFSRIKVGNIGFFQMLLTSIYFSVGSVVLSIMCTSMLAYVSTKYKFPCSGWFYYIVLFTMFLPLYGTGGSEYELYSKLGFINSPLQIIANAGGMSVNYLYFNAFYRGLSNTYMEAAEIDGANEWQIFFRVIFPQSMGITGALALTMWTASWNGYQGFLIYMPKLPNLAAGIYLFYTEAMYNAEMNVFFGACFLVSIPPIILFAFFNKVLTSNVSLGGIKE